MLVAELLHDPRAVGALARPWVSGVLVDVLVHWVLKSRRARDGGVVDHASIDRPSRQAVAAYSHTYIQIRATHKKGWKDPPPKKTHTGPAEDEDDLVVEERGHVREHRLCRVDRRLGLSLCVGQRGESWLVVSCRESVPYSNNPTEPRPDPPLTSTRTFIHTHARTLGPVRPHPHTSTYIHTFTYMHTHARTYPWTGPRAPPTTSPARGSAR